jgi:hypothetical protein
VKRACAEDGGQKILVTPQTGYFAGGNDGEFTTQRVAVSKDGVKPPQ